MIYNANVRKYELYFSGVSVTESRGDVYSLMHRAIILPLWCKLPINLGTYIFGDVIFIALQQVDRLGFRCDVFGENVI